MGLSAFIIITVLLLFVFSIGRYKETLKPLNKDDYAFLFMIPSGLQFMDLIKYSYTAGNTKLRQSFAELHGEKNAKFYLKIHMANKISTAMLCLFIVSAISLFLSVQSLTAVKVASLASMRGNDITGPAFNPNTYKDSGAGINVEAEINTGGQKITKRYTINPNMRLPDDPTCVDITINELERDFIAKNKSSFESGLSSSLDFSQYGSRLGCKVTIKTDPSQPYLSESGKLTAPGPELTEPMATSACFIVSKGDITKQTTDFNLKILPVTIDPVKELDQIVQDINIRNNGVISLPQTIGQAAVSWSQIPEPPNNTKYAVFIGGVFIAMLFLILLDSNVDKSVKQKRERIKRDFPDFVNKYVLLLGCGLTSYDAFSKILADHKNMTKSRVSQPIYDELETTLREIDFGKAEAYAYEDFGLRCRVTETMKFSSLVVQNLRRGTNDLLLMLKEQVSDVWQVHKADIRRRAEEAGTYLVFPMILSLVSVLLLVIYPALASVNL